MLYTNTRLQSLQKDPGPYKQTSLPKNPEFGVQVSSRGVKRTWTTVPDGPCTVTRTEMCVRPTLSASAALGVQVR